MAKATEPIIVSLGKQRRKRIRDLKRGTGKLMDEVDGVVEQVRAGLGDEEKDTKLVPIVLVYRQKQKRRKGRGLLGVL